MPFVPDQPRFVPDAAPSESLPMTIGKGIFNRITPIAAAEQLSNISDLAGSGVTEGASRLGLSPEMSAGLGTAANIGLGTAIAGGGGKAVASLAAPALESMAARLMKSSIKASPKHLKSGDADRAVETMLDRGINATAGGMEATQAKVTALEGKIDEILTNSLGKIDPQDVAISTLKKSLGKITYGTDPKSDMVIIDKAINTFLQHPQVEGAEKITVATANKLKQGITKELGDAKFGVGLPKQSAEVMTDKMRAATLREGIAKEEAAVVPTLAEQAELLNVLKVAGAQAAREGNKNIISFGSLSPTLQGAVIWMIDRYPWAKSMIARALYSGSTRLPEGAAGMGIAAGQDINQLLKR